MEEGKKMIHARGYHCEDASRGLVSLVGAGNYLHTHIFTRAEGKATQLGLHRQQPDPLPHEEGN